MDTLISFGSMLSSSYTVLPCGFSGLLKLHPAIPTSITSVDNNKDNFFTISSYSKALNSGKEYITIALTINNNYMSPMEIERMWYTEKREGDLKTLVLIHSAKPGTAQ